MRPAIVVAAAHDFFLMLSQPQLHRVPDLPADDRLMIVHKVLALVLCVLVRLLRQEVPWGLFLQELIPDVGFVAENVPNSADRHRLPLQPHDPHGVHRAGDVRQRLPLKIHLEDDRHDAGVLVGHQLTVHAVIAQDAVVAQIVLAALEPLPVSPFHVLGNRPALVLGNRRQEGEHHGAGRVGGVQVLLLEPDVHAVALEDLHILLTFNHVPRKPGDRLHRPGAFGLLRRERGYVLRRLLRRAARHGRLLGITKPFLCDVCDTVINENANAYPELAEKRDYIKKIIGVEEEAFAKTIDKGTELLNQFTDKLAAEGGKVLSGDDAFKLSDTYGFPIDLTEEICEEKGYTVDRERFTELAKEQRARAKADHAAKAGSSGADNSIKVDAPATIFTGYTDFEAEDAEILAIYRDGNEVETAVEGDDVVIVLDVTPFYAESGGQVGDTGMLINGANIASVDDTIKSEGHFLHIATVEQGSISKGDKVLAQIEKGRRMAIMRNHTTAHLLQHALRQVLGDHVHQAGQLVNEKACRFDFNHFSAMTDEEIARVEEIVNSEIMEAFPVTMQEMPIDEARKLGAMALFGEKYGDTVRVVTANKSVEFCGGTHISNSAQIGLFKIVSESSVAAGVRRIEAVTGKGVLELMNSFKDTIIRSAKALKLANINELPEKCAAIAAESKEKDKKLESLTQQIANSKTAALFDNAKEVCGVKIVSARMDGSAPDALRKLGDSVKDKEEAIIALFAGTLGEKGTFYCVCTKEAVAKGANAGKIVREIAALTGGKGGGKPDGAMAGAGDIAKIDEAIGRFADVVSDTMK